MGKLTIFSRCPGGPVLDDLQIPILLLEHRIDQNCLIRLTATHQVGQGRRFLQRRNGVSKQTLMAGIANNMEM